MTSVDPFEHHEIIQVPLDGLDDFGDTCMFTFERGGEELLGFVLRRDDGGLAAFVNRCPHVPYTLDFGDGRVFDKAANAFVCSSHGARFRPDGLCFAGPVVGKHLESLPIRTNQQGSFADVAITDEPKNWP